MYEMTWPNQDAYVKAFVKKTETEGLYWYEIFVCRKKMLVGAMEKNELSELLPKLKTRP